VSSSQVYGEVNLFGFEDNPTFQENRDRLMTHISMIREIDNLLMSFQRQNKVYISEIPGEQNSLKEKLRELIKICRKCYSELTKDQSREKLCIGEIQKAGTFSFDHKLSYLTFVLTFLELSLIQQQIVREQIYLEQHNLSWCPLDLYKLFEVL
jgi:hypothetical protein